VQIRPFLASMVLGGFALAATIGCLPLPAFGAAPSSPVEMVLACLSVHEPQARLACFDRAVPGLRQAPAPSAAPSSPSDALTLSAPSSAALAPPAAMSPAAPLASRQLGEERVQKSQEGQPDPTEDRIEARIIQARQLGDGRWVFTLDNGQVWRQVVAQAFPLSKPGQRVTVSRAIFGSYTLKREDLNTTLKVTRDR
jgi:hypothetical protein